MVLVKMKEGRTKFRKGASRASYILLNLKLKSQVNVAPSALSWLVNTKFDTQVHSYLPAV